MGECSTRTRFRGCQCTVCEEPLQYLLKGERVIQFSCLHAAHETCFYEFVGDEEAPHCPECNAADHLAFPASLRTTAFVNSRDPEEPKHSGQLIKSAEGAPCEAIDSALDFSHTFLERRTTQASPSLLVLSEFPTITRSMKQQSITLLVSVGVAHRNNSNVIGDGDACSSPSFSLKSTKDGNTWTPWPSPALSRAPQYLLSPRRYDQNVSSDQFESGIIAFQKTATSRSSSTDRSTAPTEYSPRTSHTSAGTATSRNKPLDIVLVIQISTLTGGPKNTFLRDTIEYMIENLGIQDRLALVATGINSEGLATPLTGLVEKGWSGWTLVVDNICSRKNTAYKVDLSEGVKVAIDVLDMYRSSTPLSLSSILVIGQASLPMPHNLDDVIARAERACVSIFCFDCGLGNAPDDMVALSTRSHALYTYVKDETMLRDAISGCLGSLQSTSHHNVKLKFTLPDGLPAKIIRIMGVTESTLERCERTAEATLGDLRFGDRRDLLVQLLIGPTAGFNEQLPRDSWDQMVTTLEALGKPLWNDESKHHGSEEVPLLRADLSYTAIEHCTSSPHPGVSSLFAMTILPMEISESSRRQPSITPRNRPHPAVLARRMELLTSDMLARSLTLVEKGQNDRAYHLLRETRRILRGLTKGGLPSIPSQSLAGSPQLRVSSRISTSSKQTRDSLGSRRSSPMTGSIVDPALAIALDTVLQLSVDRIEEPEVFLHTTRKAVLQAIGNLRSQRAFTFRSPLEALWAGRVPQVRIMLDRSQQLRGKSGSTCARVDNDLLSKSKSFTR